jgi:hypothetical protein
VVELLWWLVCPRYPDINLWRKLLDFRRDFLKVVARLSGGVVDENEGCRFETLAHSMKRLAPDVSKLEPALTMPLTRKTSHGDG